MGTSSPRVTIIGLNFSPEPTGIAPYTTGLAEGLQGLDWSVRVVTAYPHYPAWRIAEGYPGLTMHDDVSGIPVTRLRPYLPRNPSGLKRLLVELSFGIRSIFASWGSPDVVVLISPALFAAAIALLRAKLSRRRPQVILWVQDLYSVGVAETGELGGFGARIMTKVEALILRGSDRVVAIHERFAQHMVARLHVPSSDIEVVRNWTHLDIAALDASEYRHKFGWGNEVVVLHAGNMGAKQALENVIDAARIADSENVPIRFVLLGNGNQRDNLQILGAGITRLDFMESLEDIDFQGAMAAADILLVNEKRGVTEMAVPSKLTSYFAAGRPVIAATDVGSITAEEISAAGAGVRVDAGDPHALLRAALTLGRDIEGASALGGRGARFQKEVLSRDAAISHYAEIINGLAGKSGL